MFALLRYAPVGASLAHTWRTGGDDGNWDGIVDNIDKAAALWQYAGAGERTFPHIPCFIMISALRMHILSIDFPSPQPPSP